MSDHYYSENPGVQSEPRPIRFHVRGVELELTSDAGVFSKAGLDFGTRLLIETAVLPEVGLIVDLGCGYGAVGAVLGRVYPNTRWVLLDVNARAVDLATVNTRSLGERVAVRESDGLRALGEDDPDAVLLNPPIRAGKSVVYGLFEESLSRLKTGGALWVVMHKKHGADSALRFLEERFCKVTLEARKSGYHVFACRK